MELLINSSMIPIVKDWKSLCAFENTQVSSSSLSSSSESSSPFSSSSSSSSFECIDLITFLNKSDLESLLTLYNDSLVTDPSFAFASSVSSSISGSSFTSSSASSASAGSSKFVPELVVQVIWSIVFGLMILVAMVGNTTVIWIVTGHRKMRTVTNVFLLNLTIADLIMATFNGVFNFVYMLHSHWPFGQTYCKINNFIANVTVASSVFTITATSIDRYIAVVHPLKPRMTKHQVMLIIIMVWSLAALLSLPNLLYSELFTIPFQDGGYRVVCILVWPDGYAGQSTLDYLYNLTFLAITYVIPMISLIITYSLMSRVLWGSKGIGEETDIQRESIRSKQKVARMLIALVVLFAICWLPYHAYFLYSYHYPHINQSVIIQHIYLFSYWLAMSNSMYNPLVYYWMNKRFRSYFASIFCFFSRNRLKKQLSYNVKTDLSSNGFQHGTTHYRRTPVQSSNQIELHQRNNLDDPDYPTCNNPSKGYPETKLNLNPSKQSNGYLLQQSSDSTSPLILNNVFRGVLINGNTINGDNSDNNNSTFNGQNNGHANGNSLTNSQSIVHNNNNNNNHNNQNDSKSNHGANCECNRLLSC
ncbi:tachykinin-like peptides receptor 86C [Tetranychus urticae]|uniref:G-protein coupled receptors family 1 profile domain-containing protein n=1 Tax=Tetranychus urticae TaxID=32264 RepID=T1KTS6_TETUR|nr:tachykinin-like peptides receptor 86C [Tetranychus urticae]